MGAYRPSLWLELTGECNLACTFCYNPWRPLPANESPTSLGAPALLEIVTRLRSTVDFSFVALSGGEPLMYPELGELIAGIGRLGLWTVLTTNGTLLTTRKLSELRDAGLGSIQISLTSIREGVHNALTRSHSWRTTIAAIARSASSGMGTTVVVTATAANLPDLIPTAIFLRDVGVRRIVVSRLQLSGSAAVNADDLVMPEQAVLDAIAAVEAEVGQSVDLEVSPPLAVAPSLEWHRWAISPDGVLKLCNTASTGLGEVLSMADAEIAQLHRDWSAGEMGQYAAFADSCGCFARRAQATSS